MTQPDSASGNPKVWTAATLSPTDGLLQFEPAHHRELETAAARLISRPLPTDALDPADFDLTACVELMQRAGEILDVGVGFVLLDRLPIESLDVEVSTGLFWLLLRLLGRPVAQKWDGTVLYEVTDRGRPLGDGVRADVTRVGQGFHSDNSYNHSPPTQVSLLCLRPARSGGISGIVSLPAVYRELRRRRPDIAARLEEPFHFDRQREHGPDEPPTISHPMFFRNADGSQIYGRVSTALAHRGHEKADDPLDALGAEALHVLAETMELQELRREFHLEPGQIQILDNLHLAHRRTEFEDWPDPDRKRLLLRLWLREWGASSYVG